MKNILFIIAIVVAIMLVYPYLGLKNSKNQTPSPKFISERKEVYENKSVRIENIPDSNITEKKSENNLTEIEDLLNN